MGKEPTHPYVDKMKRTTKLLAQEITQNASEVIHSTDDNRRIIQQSEQRSIQIPSQETTPYGESVLTPHPVNPQHQNGLSEANEPIQGLQDGTRESAQIRNGKNLMTEDTLHNFRALAQRTRRERERNTRHQSTESTPSIGPEPECPPPNKNTSTAILESLEKDGFPKHVPLSQCIRESKKQGKFRIRANVVVEQISSKRALVQHARRERERKERTPVEKRTNYISQAQAPQRWRSLSLELDGVNTHTVPKVCVSTLNSIVNLSDHYSHTLEIRESPKGNDDM
ncbi:hypothetical protein GIB67_034101 [Kingdonia uniflora]|uniref:Uncharacterized protein n=1 Tax=Kingdonia uniflora TaxID=39325 RepID=A0A7J7M6D4_9MAGN|nr:hypothetical protein GIB67_034101 [Kingdonia uniflora]